MPCPIRTLTLLCVVSSLSNCAPRPPIEDFCIRYRKVVVEKGDGNIVAKPAVKKRILANEIDYRTCPQ